MPWEILSILSSVHCTLSVGTEVEALRASAASDAPLYILRAVAPGTPGKPRIYDILRIRFPF